MEVGAYTIILDARSNALPPARRANFTTSGKGGA